MTSEGLVTGKDIEEAKSNKGRGAVSIGLPEYCLLQRLLRAAKVSSMDILIGKWSHLQKF